MSNKSKTAKKNCDILKSLWISSMSCLNIYEEKRNEHPVCYWKMFLNEFYVSSISQNLKAKNIVSRLQILS